MIKHIKRKTLKDHSKHQRLMFPCHEVPPCQLPSYHSTAEGFGGTVALRTHRDLLGPDLGRAAQEVAGDGRRFPWEIPWIPDTIVQYQYSIYIYVIFINRIHHQRWRFTTQHNPNYPMCWANLVDWQRLTWIRIKCMLHALIHHEKHQQQH